MPPGLHVEVVDGSIASLVSGAHGVVAGNTTSAAVDAFATGARVFVHDDATALNVSPLRGVPGAIFVRNGEDLVAGLRSLTAEDGRESAPSFFHLDRDLPRWRAYFGLDRRAASTATGAARRTESGPP
jgi:surface carbohydrate biosynthesis protein (TIGR04326 family)